jgi:hypothetical protein
VSSTYVNPALFANYLPPQMAVITHQPYDRQAELNAGHVLNVNKQRGDPKNKDAIFSIQLKTGFVSGRERRK